jgi:hypothetical protein
MKDDYEYFTSTFGEGVLIVLLTSLVVCSIIGLALAINS